MVYHLSHRFFNFLAVFDDFQLYGLSYAEAYVIDKEVKEEYYEKYKLKPYGLHIYNKKNFINTTHI